MASIVQATVEVGKTYQEALTAAGVSGNPTRTNYTFVGWNTQADGSGTTIQLTDVVTATITIYAQWQAGQTTDTISYDANGGSGTMDNQTAPVGQTVQLASNTFTRTGYTFSGWATSANGAVVYQNQATITMPTSLALFAVWAQSQYKIYYDKNNENATGTMEPSVQTGSSVVVKSCAYALSGYSFADWATTPSSPAGARYNPGDTITLSEDITLYARWEV